MEEVTAGVYLVSISQSRYSAVYNGGHAKTVFLHAAISAAAHQTCEMLMNVNFRICRDERSELVAPHALMAPARRVMSHEYGSTQFDSKIQMSWFLPGSTRTIVRAGDFTL